MSLSPSNNRRGRRTSRRQEQEQRRQHRQQQRRQQQRRSYYGDNDNDNDNDDYDGDERDLISPITDTRTTTFLTTSTSYGSLDQIQQQQQQSRQQQSRQRSPGTGTRRSLQRKSSNVSTSGSRRSTQDPPIRHPSDASARYVPYIKPGANVGLDSWDTDDGIKNDEIQNDDGDDDDSDDEELLFFAKERLLQRAENFTLSYNAESGYRAKEFHFCNIDRPHMRAMHASWICFFASYFVQFAMSPLLPQIQVSLNLTKRDIWWSNVWMMVGGIPMRFILGPLCDSYGPRTIMVYMLILCAIPCALSGFIIFNGTTLLLVRFVIGAMDAFVPSQCWITSHFAREVSGTIMAIASGLGATGAAFTQLVVGYLFDVCANYLSHVLATTTTSSSSSSSLSIEGEPGRILLMSINETVSMSTTSSTTTATNTIASSTVGTGDADIGTTITDDEHYDLAWRIVLLVPAAFAFVIAYISYHYTDDCPLGNFLDVKRAGLMMERSAVDSFRSVAYNINSWLLFWQFAASCGVDVTMCNGCAVYFFDKFHQSIATAGLIAFLYGISALYARGFGGYISDQLGKKYSLAGRIWINFIFMIIQGLLNIWFARTTSLGRSIVIMLLLSIVIQFSMGTTYGVVPYVDSPNTGSVAGIVGGGGNVGGVALGMLFIYHDYEYAMEYMGYFTICMAFLSPFIIIRGYKGMCFGTENKDDATRKQHSPLMVPGKLHNSPYLIKMRRKMRRMDI